MVFRMKTYIFEYHECQPYIIKLHKKSFKYAG